MLLRTPILRIVAAIAIVLLLAPPGRAQTDKAATVVNEMISALGGKAFLDVREFTATGKVFVFKRERAAGSETFMDYVRYPDKRRSEYGTYKIKPTVIHNGDAGWEVNDKKIESLPETEVKDFQAASKTSFQYLARFVLNQPGVTLLLAGTEMIDFKRNDVLEFRDSGNFYRLFVDQQSHLPTKLQVRRAGETFMREDQFANWHVYQGVRTALFVIRYQDGEKINEFRFENFNYNPGLADSLFAAPTAR